MAKIMGYEDYQIGNVTILRVYYLERLGHNLFFVGQFCDSNLEYTLSLGDMIVSSPICLLSKALKTKSWLWHRRLSHLNFGALNHLAKHGLVRGLPKLTSKKYHLCSACAMGKNFDELTAMASEHRSLEPALHEMTRVTISSGLISNLPSSTLFVPPTRTDWDLLFQPMFDELLNPPPSVDPPSLEVIASIGKVVAREAVASTCLPSSTTVDQDAPSPSNS
nr:hypothetical protein [Tanacetum cinerariifolium]